MIPSMSHSHLSKIVRIFISGFQNNYHCTHERILGFKIMLKPIKRNSLSMGGKIYVMERMGRNKKICIIISHVPLFYSQLY